MEDGAFGGADRRRLVGDFRELFDADIIDIEAAWADDVQFHVCGDGIFWDSEYASEDIEAFVSQAAAEIANSRPVPSA